MGRSIQHARVSKQHCATIISVNSKITGQVSTDCNIHVDGIVDGLLHSGSSVTVSKTGSVMGYIYSKELTIAGKFEGNAECERIHVVAGGEFLGNVTASEFVVEEDAIFEGEIQNRRRSIKALENKTEEQPNVCEVVELKEGVEA